MKYSTHSTELYIHTHKYTLYSYTGACIKYLTAPIIIIIPELYNKQWVKFRLCCETKPYTANTKNHNTFTQTQLVKGERVLCLVCVYTQDNIFICNQPLDSNNHLNTHTHTHTQVVVP